MTQQLIHVDHFEDKLLKAKLSIQNMDSYVLYCILMLPSSHPSSLKSHQIFTLSICVLLGLAGSKLNCHSLQSCSVALATRLADGQGGSGMNFG